MNIRRLPFQFTSIDPVKRQAELQKRFGLPANDMYVDCVNPGIMGTGTREPTSVGSPRLQHRVPLFIDGLESKTLPDQSNNVDGHKPKVRVIPIQVEGADGISRRHRTFSGPAGSTNNSCQINSTTPETFQYVKPSNSYEINKEEPYKSRVCNIPIKIESRDEKSKEFKVPIKPETTADVKVNGCNVSKVEEKQPKPYENIPLKQIENVLNKFKTYEAEVEKFTGGPKDKQYRYLDEMLTRCMLDLDNIDTLGRDVVRQSRKAAVKKVQACIDLLESKISAYNESLKNQEVLDNKVEDIEMVEGNSATDLNDKELIKTVPKDTEMIETSQDVSEIEVCVSNSQLTENNTDHDVEMSSTVDQSCADVFVPSEEQGSNIEVSDLQVTNGSVPNQQLNMEMHENSVEHKNEIEIEEINSKLESDSQINDITDVISNPVESCEITDNSSGNVTNNEQKENIEFVDNTSEDKTNCIEKSNIDEISDSITPIDYVVAVDKS